MTAFEYVMVIVSIIIGLGITVLLKGTVMAVRRESALVPGLLHGLWVAGVLVQHVLLWSLRWGGVRRDDWPGVVLLVYLLLPIIYYAQAELLFPEKGRNVGLTDYFIENRRPFFLLAALSFVAGALGPFAFYEGVAPVAPDGSGDQLAQLPAYAALFVASLVMAWTDDRRLHMAWAVAHLAVMTWALAALGVG